VATPSGAPNNTWITNTASFSDGLGGLVTRTVSTLLQTYDLSSSEKVMPASARPGETITCSLYLRNTGVVSVQAGLTDTLPGGVTLVPGSLWWSSGEGGEAAGVVTWHGEIIARGMVLVRLQVRLGQELPAGARLSNSVWIQDQDGRLYERAATTTIHTGAYPYAVYLPLVLKARVAVSLD
jgi:uncharacterized repeat protein (TIGR01451 family)